jgi:hypothetical protein
MVLALPYGHLFKTKFLMVMAFLKRLQALSYFMGFFIRFNDLIARAHCWAPWKKRSVKISNTEARQLLVENYFHTPPLALWVTENFWKDSSDRGQPYKSK